MCDIFPFMPRICPEKACRPHVFDGLVLDRSLAVASAPYDAIGSETQLLIMWAKGYKVSWPLESSEWSLPLKSEGCCCIPYASKPARPLCSINNLVYRPGRSSSSAGEQTGQKSPSAQRN